MSLFRKFTNSKNLGNRIQLPIIQFFNITLYIMDNIIVNCNSTLKRTFIFHFGI